MCVCVGGGKYAPKIFLAFGFGLLFLFYFSERSFGSLCSNPQYLCCETNSIRNISSNVDTVIYPLPKPSRNCECVSIDKCQLYDGTIIKNTNGEGLIDLRYVRLLWMWTLLFYPKLISTLLQNYFNSFGECPDSQHICCDQLRESSEMPKVNFVRKQENCGVRHEDGVGFKIRGGNEAQFGEFPWVVIIFKKKFKDGREFLQFNCGGSLIHPKVILTAAHCVRSYVWVYICVSASKHLEFPTSRRVSCVPSVAPLHTIRVHSGATLPPANGA